MNRIFPHDTRREALNVHLYFVKLFLGMIVEGGVPIEAEPFRSAILNRKAHPNVHLKFGLWANIDSRKSAGPSNLEVELSTTDGSCAFAIWQYEPGSGIAAQVMFARDDERREGLFDAWHPKCGSTRLILANLDSAGQTETLHKANVK